MVYKLHIMVCNNKLAQLCDLQQNTAHLQQFVSFFSMFLYIPRKVHYILYTQTNN